MKPLIGGKFGLERLSEGCTSRGLAHILQGNSVAFSNGRSAIGALVARLGTARIWVPSYLCPTMLSAVDRSQVEVRYFEVDTSLRISKGEWLKELASQDLVVMIEYFGFPTDRHVAARVKAHGAWLLRDACQALFGEPDHYADFSLYSPRKLVGVPDGGILTLQAHFKEPLSESSLAPLPQKWLSDTVSAMTCRRLFDEGESLDRSWFRQLADLERETPVGNYRISALSSAILRTSVDGTAISQARRSNFEQLLRRFRDIAVFKTLPANVVPLGFPVRLDRRDEVQSRLFEQQIYPPIHWDLRNFRDAQGDVFESSLALSRSILTIPCDHRYHSDDMRRVADALAELI